MFFEFDGDEIKRITYLEDMTAEIEIARKGEIDYDTLLSDYAAQEAAGYVVFDAPTITGAAPQVWQPPALPAGTKLLVRIESGAITTVEGSDLTQPIELTDPGHYELLLLPPAPDRGWAIAVDLT